MKAIDSVYPDTLGLKGCHMILPAAKRTVPSNQIAPALSGCTYLLLRYCLAIRYRSNFQIRCRLSTRSILGVGSSIFGGTTLVRPIKIPFLRIRRSFLCGSHCRRQDVVLGIRYWITLYVVPYYAIPCHTIMYHTMHLNLSLIRILIRVVYPSYMVLVFLLIREVQVQRRSPRPIGPAPKFVILPE